MIWSWGAVADGLWRLLRPVLQSAEVSANTLPGRLGMFGGFAYLFLWVPDLDFLLMPLLHHRSIVTHSLLPVIAFALLAPRFGAAPVAGAMIGTSVHLACDMLSPMKGYAQIWLPFPFKTPLGTLSYLWLAANAVIGFAAASLVARKAFDGRAFPLVVVLSVVTGATYGLLNERTLASILVVLLMIGVSLYPEGWMRRRARGL